MTADTASAGQALIKTSPETRTARAAVALFGAAPLYFLYFVFLSVFLPGLSITNSVEAAIVYTQIIRLLLLASVRRFREGSPQFKITLFSIEVFVIAALIAAFFFTGDPGYNALIGQVLLVWIGATFLLVTPYALFRLGVAMYRGESLYSVLNYAAWEYVSVLFLADIFSRGSVPTTVQGLGVAVINAITGEIRTGSEVFTYASPDVAASVVFFVALIIYATYVNSPGEAPPKNYYPLVLPIVSTLFCVLWVALLVQWTADIFVILSAPALGLSVGLWWLTRLRKGAKKILDKAASETYRARPPLFPEAEVK
jgi:hypothetical protein